MLNYNLYFVKKKKLRSLFGGKSIESLVIFISTFSLEYCIFSIINMKSNELPLLKKEKILYNINKHKNMYFFFVGVCNYNQLSKNIVLISKTMYIYMVFTFIKKNKKYVFFLYCLLYILRITSVVQKSLIYDSLWVDFNFLHRSQVELRTGEVIQNYCFLTSRSTSNARKLNSKELSCQSFFLHHLGFL
jgi:hypothetical protein